MTKLLGIGQIYQLWISCFMYKIRDNAYSSIFISLFKNIPSRHSSRRQHDYYKPHFRLKIRIQSIAFQGASIWNNIPVDIRSINNLSLFKKRIRIYILTYDLLTT